MSIRQFKSFNPLLYQDLPPMPYVRSHPLFVNVLCWWKGTELHKQPIFAVPLLPISGWCSVRQRSQMPIDTQAVFTAEALLNIARGSLGGFCIPDSTDSKPRKDNIFRFTFHGQHPETEQKPGHQLSQEDLSMPLKDLVARGFRTVVPEHRVGRSVAFEAA